METLLRTEKYSKKVVVFMPAFNEEENIGNAIEALKNTYNASQTRDFRIDIIVVDDGSTDKTSSIVKASGIPLVSHPRNLGLGAATRTGMQTARDMGADVAVKFDADLQHSPLDIEKAIRPILDDKADIVYGSRFMGEIKYKMPFIRYIGNHFFTWLMRKMTGWNISDAQTGLMVYSKKYLAVFNMPGNYNPPHQTLIDAYHKHMRYAEVPVVFNKRNSGKSFVSLKYPFNAFQQILRIVVAVNPLKVFMPLSFFFFSVAIVWAGGEYFYKYIFNSAYEVHYITHLLLFILAIQSFFFGLLAELICNRS